MWRPLSRQGQLFSTVELDEVTASIVAPFDYTFTGETSFEEWVPPTLPPDYTLGVIVGASGSGKSTLLRRMGRESTDLDWDASRSIAAQIGDAERFAAVGLNSVPTWCKPYHVLSTGEKFRADLARRIGEGVGIDEYTSTVDRTVAISASNSLRIWMGANDVRGVVIATCHRDVIPWLQPEWVIDLDTGTWSPDPEECLQRPELVVEVHEAERPLWDVFAPHHYLSPTLHPFARCYVATLEGQAVAFGSAIPFPHGHIKRGWRETRTVTLPDAQGLGIGVRLSDWIAEAHVRGGYRYFSRTTHPRMGEYRERSEEWRPTSSNRKKQTPPANGGWGRFGQDAVRIAYSHEFVGGP